MKFEDEANFEEALVAELIRNGWSENVLYYPTKKS